MAGEWGWDRLFTRLLLRQIDERQHTIRVFVVGVALLVHEVHDLLKIEPGCILDALSLGFYNYEIIVRPDDIYLLFGGRIGLRIGNDLIDSVLA